MIKEKLLTSCELTGIWEKKLRDIEHHKYDAAQFIGELKEQITQIVNDVLADNSNRHITVTTDSDVRKTKVKRRTKSGTKQEKKPRARANTKTAAQQQGPKSGANPLPADDSIIGQACPLCGKGTIVKGKSAYGCSRWREGCAFRLPFKQ